ncbi:hypothetical protein IWT140_02078 [Secundilactobacillus pentosiphilus]|uniref:Uncharacterized protein n=1 Tax=Secundilactobacillus pentosiphilus TaxID=1714682 RepID=A0A1Z5IRT3_9LACO|nr:hypothetical protein [Secundilactobacillus pentosiphilus]GAX04440.1 hypothetical protein IWT140_02078 [Secundilactobacillus pentosiphilus]GAX05077.1 hypothetical protein IWT25_00380 [Secundilactobacillus pentosiphilus]
MANWFSKKRAKHRVLGGSNSDHEIDYGELFTNYMKDKQQNISRQRQQAQKLSHQIKKEQQRNS